MHWQILMETTAGVLQNFQPWTKMEHMNDPILNPISLQNFHAKLSAADNNGTDECNFSPKLSGHAVGGVWGRGGSKLESGEKRPCRII